MKKQLLKIFQCSYFQPPIVFGCCRLYLFLYIILGLFVLVLYLPLYFSSVLHKMKTHDGPLTNVYNTQLLYPSFCRRQPAIRKRHNKNHLGNSNQLRVLGLKLVVPFPSEIAFLFVCFSSIFRLKDTHCDT